MITQDDIVTNTYKGETDGCACGCRGTYRPLGTKAAKIRIDFINNNWDQVKCFDTYSDEIIYELKTAHRVVRIYVSGNSRPATPACENCGEKATVYAMDTIADGWAGRYCDSHIPKGFYITDRY